jgi:hypothetical protein
LYDLTKGITIWLNCQDYFEIGLLKFLNYSDTDKQRFSDGCQNPQCSLDSEVFRLKKR